MDDDRIDDALRDRMRKLGIAPDVAPALDGFRATRTRRRRRRRVGMAIASIVVVAAGAVGLRAAVDAGDEDSSGVVTDPGVTTGPPHALPDVLGLDYRDATAALEDAGLPLGDGHIRWTISVVTDGPSGEVLGMTPSVGDTPAVDDDIVLRVAVPEGDLGGRPLAGSELGSAGVLDGSSAPECQREMNGQTGDTVVFIGREVVGCFYRSFVWLDELDAAFQELGTMPDVIGLDAGTAREVIGREVPGAEIFQFPSAPAGAVLATQPMAGDRVVRLAGVLLTFAPPDEPGAADFVYVYFPRSNGDACTATAASTREVAVGADAVEVAFRSLFGGPVTDLDGLPGDVWWFPPDPDALLGATLRDGLLTVDVVPLREWLGGNASTACGSNAFLSAMQATAFQFADVEAVRVTQEGSCEAATGFFEGVGCNTYTRADWLSNR